MTDQNKTTPQEPAMLEIEGRKYHATVNYKGREIEGNCHICGWPKNELGAGICSYPHAMVPDHEVSPGMWAWRYPNE